MGKEFKLKGLVPLVLLLSLGIFGALIGPGESPKEAAPINGADTAWMLTATALVLFMTPGLAFFYGGMVSRKNVIATMLQSYAAIGVVSLLWILVGFSLAFGESFHGIIGNPFTYVMFRGVTGATNADLSPTIPLVLFALFQMKFAIITPALITGSFAERIRFSAFIVFVCLWSVLIYAPLAHWAWHPQGFLRAWGLLDFAGGTVVHMSAGCAAIAAALVLGRRVAHLEKHESVPANIPFVLLGTGLLWFGWFGFNAGSALAANETAAMAFLTTNTASAAAMLTWLCADAVRGRQPSAVGACIGAVVGLVAVTPAAGFVTVGSSILIGVTASLVCNIAVAMKARTAVDDTLDVFPCHGVGGMVGMVMTGVFAQGVGLAYGQTGTFLVHLLALVLVSTFTFVGSYLLLKLTALIIPLRVSHEQEELGLDLSLHGEHLDGAALAREASRVNGLLPRMGSTKEVRIDA